MDKLKFGYITNLSSKLVSNTTPVLIVKIIIVQKVCEIIAAALIVKLYLNIMIRKKFINPLWKNLTM